MTEEARKAMELFSVFGLGVVLTLLIGFYSLLTTRNLIRALIGLEVLTKAVTLLIVVAGYVSGQMALAQALAITLIVIEVAVIVAAISIVLCVHRNTGSVDSTQLQNVKG
jgi:multisubunit Na+/H+ antiporter MnhC subunit